METKESIEFGKMIIDLDEIKREVGRWRTEAPNNSQLTMLRFDVLRDKLYKLRAQHEEEIK